MPSNAPNLKSSADQHYQYALKFFNEGNLPLALNSIDLAIESAEDKSFYLLQKINFLFLKEDFYKCISIIQLTLSHLYQNCSLLDFACILDIYQNCQKEDKEPLQTLLATHNLPYILKTEYLNLVDDCFDDFFHQASIHYTNKDFETCIAYTSLHLKLFPDNLAALNLQAECYVALNQLDLALTTYRHITTLEEPTSTLFHTIATLYQLNNDPFNAITYFNLAHQKQPENIDHLIELSKACILNKSYEPAINNLHKALDLSPDNITVYTHLGTAYAGLKNDKLAKKYHLLASRSPTITYKTKTLRYVIFTLFCIALVALSFFFFR